MTEVIICKRCIMDTTDPEIKFDENGFCNHCNSALKKIGKIRTSLPLQNRHLLWESLVKGIKNDGLEKEYDCIIGVSGGIDSTYVAYLVHQAGLRPLAVHLDNGWDSEISVKNIENICKKLNIDLFTKVLDWEEFKELQLSFLKASTPDSEILTDHAIFSSLYKKANEIGVKYIISGSNIESESILPRLWSYGHYDWKYIKNVHKTFGHKRLKDFPHLGIMQLNYFLNIKKIRWISALDYFNYNKVDAKKIIMDELGWTDYGGKHCESIYTKFYQSYILPTKFNFDKRKAHLSSLIVSGQILREKALEELENPIYEKQQLINEIDYFKKKFDLSDEDFQKIMESTPKYFYEYKNNSSLFNLLIKIKRLLFS